MILHVLLKQVGLFVRNKPHVFVRVAGGISGILKPGFFKIQAPAVNSHTGQAKQEWQSESSQEKHCALLIFNDEK